MSYTPIVLSVSQLNMYIRAQFEGDENLGHVFLCGEISNFTNHYKSGHLYLSLKDEKSVIRAVMFALNARKLRFLPQDGMKVIVRGRVSVYEATGQYQLYIEDMQPDGLGALNLAFEQLKRRLEAEGLFSQERKMPIPKYPERIGVITSPTGAAVHDITTILARRYPLAEVVFCPVLVQGSGAAPQLVEALNRFNRLQCADVIILGRGGGSLEDLWPFNEEAVARAVAESQIPIISAVGHETDFTICDFVADLRAPTPSAAAELAVPDCNELMQNVRQGAQALYQNMQAKLDTLKRRLDTSISSYSFQKPRELIDFRRIRVDHTAARLSVGIRQKMEMSRTCFSAVSGRLNALSPLATLSRGFCIVYDENGKSVIKAAQVQDQERISVRFQDGIVVCLAQGREDSV